ncbi:MAG: HAD hydrolase family protein [Candidatus Microthrix sp.]|nr:HAD hydrolase family protein [Candidatus Microthrix sp.]
MTACERLAVEHGWVLEYYSAFEIACPSTEPLAVEHAGLLGLAHQPRSRDDLTGPLVRLQFVVPIEDTDAVLSAVPAGAQGTAATSPALDHAAFISVTKAGVSKATAIAKLAQRLGFGPEAVMMVGDGQNDVSAMESVGWGVAMGNADPTALAASRLQVGHVDADGLADALALSVDLAERGGGGGGGAAPPGPPSGGPGGGGARGAGGGGALRRSARRATRPHLGARAAQAFPGRRPPVCRGGIGRINRPVAACVVLVRAQGVGHRHRHAGRNDRHQHGDAPGEGSLIGVLGGQGVVGHDRCIGHGGRAAVRQAGRNRWVLLCGRGRRRFRCRGGCGCRRGCGCRCGFGDGNLDVECRLRVRRGHRERPVT